MNRESGYSTNSRGNINFRNMIDKNSEAGQPNLKEDFKKTEYRNIYWINKGFPHLAHTAASLNIEHFN